jgi:uncharacterized membrane protein YphA (DoxX/SURF4 family)
MGITRAILIGTLYTIVSFALSFFFLHLATMFWFHQSGFAFLQDMDAGRIAAQQQAVSIDPGSFQAIFLKTNVFYFIITLVIAGILILNINHQYNKEQIN